MTPENFPPKNNPLDRTHLFRICQGDQRKLLALLDKALLILTTSATVLQETFSLKQEDLFLREIHKLKGSLGIIDPYQLYEEVRSLEASYKEWPADVKTERTKTILAKLDSLITDIDKELKQQL